MILIVNGQMLMDNGLKVLIKYNKKIFYFFSSHLVNPYDNGTSTNNLSSTATDASGMDPAWLAYYQSMSYYSMMQASMAGATSSGTETGTTTTAATDSTAASSNNSTTPGR